MYILLGIIAFVAVFASAFGVAGMGSSRETLKLAGFLITLASLALAFFLGGIPLLVATAFGEFFFFAILAKTINDRHHGIDFDSGRRHANEGIDDLFARMAKEDRKTRKH